jgi:hypothetical protein
MKRKWNTCLQSLLGVAGATLIKLHRETWVPELTTIKSGLHKTGNRGKERVV